MPNKEGKRVGEAWCCIQCDALDLNANDYSDTFWLIKFSPHFLSPSP